jgi:phosphatidylinositol glycan class B
MCYTRNAHQNPPNQMRQHRRDWTLLELLAFALLIRMLVIIAFPGLYHSDENFQSFEPAHRIAFGTGIVSFEFVLGMRSLVFPYLYASLFALAEPLVGGPEGYLTVAKLVLAISSLAGVAAVYQMGKRTSSTHALIVGFAAATWFELVYFAGRPITEAIATTVLLVGLSLASVPELRLTRLRALAIGFCLGLCLMLRVHLAIGLFVAALFVGKSHLRARWLPMALGGLVPVVVFGATDWVAYGAPFHTYIEYVKVNLIQGLASDYGVQPIGWYFERLLVQWKYAAPILALFIVVRLRRSMIWIATATAIIASHSVIPHKEYRFILPAVACLVIVAAMGSSDLIEAAMRTFGRRSSRYFVFGGVAFWIAVSAALAFTDPFVFEWFKTRGLIEATFVAAKTPNLCGLLLYDANWWDTGGYAYLHRNVPLYVFDHFNAPAIKSTVGFDAVILRRKSLSEFAAKFRVQQCFASLGNEDVCLMVREGPCTHDSELDALLTPGYSSAVVEEDIEDAQHAAPVDEALGVVWKEEESGWVNLWTRRLGTNIFDSVGTKDGVIATFVVTITRNGDQVRVVRTNSSDGNNLVYAGTIVGSEVSGWYPGGQWRATIISSKTHK